MNQDSTTVRTVTDAIDHIASKLQVPAAHLWLILQRQALVEAIQGAIIFVFAVALLVIPIKMWQKVISAGKDQAYMGGWDDEGAFLGSALVSVATGVFFVVALIALTTDIGYAINPEYYALKTILGVLK